MEGGEKRNEEYKECLRNHAASLGSFATDGCREFTSHTYGRTINTGGLHCGACGCHRNFHRRVTTGVSSSSTIPGDGRQPSSPEWEIRSPKKRFRTKFTADQKEKMFAFAEKIGWKMQRSKEAGAGGAGDHEIEGFCRGIGVSRQVFKVWMHNHKNSSNSSSSTP